MKLFLYSVFLLCALHGPLSAAEPIAISVIEDFSDPQDNPQFNAEVAAALAAIAQSHPLTLSYRVIKETSDAQASQANLKVFNREMPAMPAEGQRIGDYQRAVTAFQIDLAKWKNDYLGWRGEQRAAVQAWLVTALSKQTQTSQHFALELARRGSDYRRSDVCGAVLQAARMDFPPGSRGYLILLSDLRDQPAGRAGRTTPLIELPPGLTLVLAHRAAARSPLLAGLPNSTLNAPDLRSAVKIVTDALAHVEDGGRTENPQTRTMP